jgi:hypothetical protein
MTVVQFDPLKDAIKALNKRADTLNMLIKAEENNIEANDSYFVLARNRIDDWRTELDGILRGIEYLGKSRVEAAS